MSLDASSSSAQPGDGARDDDDRSTFFSQLEHYLSTGTLGPWQIEQDQWSPEQRNQFRKDAQKYCLLDGVLHRGLARPRRVVLRPEERQDLIREHHVVGDGDGDDDAVPAHRPARATLAALRRDVFWPGLGLAEVTRFVRQCSSCRERRKVAKPELRPGADPADVGQEPVDDDDSGDDDVQVRMEEEDKENRDWLFHQRLQSGVWKKIEVAVHGPFPTSDDESLANSKHLVTLHDPISDWTLATASDTDSDGGIASFVFDAMCRFGFVKCRFFRLDPDRFRCVSDAFGKAWRTLDIRDVGHEQFLELPPPEEASSSSPSARLDEEVKELVSRHGPRWEQHLQSWLFRLSTSESGHGRTPFSLMFRRDPLCIMRREEDYADLLSAASARRRRRPLSKALLHCRHCPESFTSRVSFRLHQGRHLEAARRQGALEGEAEEEEEEEDDDEDDDDAREGRLAGLSRKRRRPAQRAKPVDPEARVVLLQQQQQQKVRRQPEPAADPSLLQTVSRRTLPAVKALLAATKLERTKRGKYVRYSAELRDEIAEYALKHGTQRACTLYSERLACSVTASSVRNFVRAFRAYGPQLKADLGRHAYQFGVDECLAEHLGRHPDLTRNLLRRFRAEFVRRHPNLQGGEDEDDDQEEEEEEEDGHDPKKGVFVAELKEKIGCYAFHCGNVDAVKYFSQKLQFPMKESTVRKFKMAWMAKNPLVVEQQPQPQQHRQLVRQQQEQHHRPFVGQQQQQPDNFTKPRVQDTSAIVSQQPHESSHAAQGESSEASNVPLSLTIGTDARNLSKPEEEQPPAKASRLRPRPSASEEPNSNKKCRRRRRRGQYANYGPEMRGLIGQFAVGHSNQETIEHFRRQHKIALPESTVRGLRDKYLLSRAGGGDKDGAAEPGRLEYGPRGRPILLGRYDAAVRQCLQDLAAESGERITSFMAIATAKQVLAHHEPDLLVENGGKVDLNTAWATSFLNRMDLDKKEAEATGEKGGAGSQSQ